MTCQDRRQGSDTGSRAPRVDTGFLVRIRCAAGTFPGRITNLSSSGFGLQSARPLEPGAEVTLEMPKQTPMKGVIRWAAGKESGGEFTEPLAI
jgi:hypothetical protein